MQPPNVRMRSYEVATDLQPAPAPASNGCSRAASVYIYNRHPPGCRSVLKKRAAAWFTMRSKGLGDASPTSRIVNYGITMPRLRLAKSSEMYQKNNTKMDIADVFSKWYNTQRPWRLSLQVRGMPVIQNEETLDFLRAS